MSSPATGPGMFAPTAPGLRRAVLLLAHLPLAFLVVALLAGMTNAVSLQDEAILLLYPERLLAGAAPYRDFQLVYGLGNFLMLAAGYLLFGINYLTERVIGLAYQSLIVGSIYWLARTRGPVVAIVAASLALLSLMPLGPAAYSWVGAVGWLLLGIASGVKAQAENSRGASSRCWWTIAGVATGLAVTYRHEMVLTVAAVSITLLWGAPRGSTRAFVLGLIPSAVVWLAIAAWASPFSLVNSLLVEARTMVSHRHLGLPPLSSLAGMRLAALVLLPTAFAVGIALARRYRSGERDRALEALGVAAVCALPQALQRADSVHIFYVAPLSLAAAAMALASVAGMLPPRHRLLTLLPISVCLLLLLVAIPAGQLLPLLAGKFRRGLDVLQGRPALSAVSHAGRTVPVPSDLAPALQAIVQKAAVLAPPDARLFVGREGDGAHAFNHTLLYHLLPQYVPATYYLEFNPGTYDSPGSRVLSELETADVAIIERNPHATLKLTPTSENGWAECFREGAFTVYARNRGCEPVNRSSETAG